MHRAPPLSIALFGPRDDGVRDLATTRSAISRRRDRRSCACACTSCTSCSSSVGPESRDPAAVRAPALKLGSQMSGLRACSDLLPTAREDVSMRVRWDTAAPWRASTRSVDARARPNLVGESVAGWRGGRWGPRVERLGGARTRCASVASARSDQVTRSLLPWMGVDGPLGPVGVGLDLAVGG